mmetsp:Transcript_18626/g.46673  ORF Transcript_18626/g.46673 Transcript_18626/m.46673 type:complete len:208 (-) Transcript_18626:761-1384(-)
MPKQSIVATNVAQTSKSQSKSQLPRDNSRVSINMPPMPMAMHRDTMHMFSDQPASEDTRIVMAHTATINIEASDHTKNDRAANSHCQTRPLRASELLSQIPVEEECHQDGVCANDGAVDSCRLNILQIGHARQDLIAHLAKSRHERVQDALANRPFPENVVSALVLFHVPEKVGGSNHPNDANDDGLTQQKHHRMRRPHVPRSNYEH